MKTPYDGRFKILAEEHPELLLRLFGIVAPGAAAEPIDILRELHLDPVQVDHVYRIGNERIVHLEAMTRWRADRVPRLALYRFLIQHRYRLPVASYLILMAEKHAPRKLEDPAVYQESDGFRIEAPYQVVRLWEIDAAIAFEPGCEALLPWAPLLRSGGQNLLERAVAAIERLAERQDRAPYPIPVMVSNLAGLAVLRYDKDEIVSLLAGLREKMMFPIDIFEDTWLYQEGKAEGEAKGKAEGLLAGKREAIALALASRFPGAGGIAEIDRIAEPAALNEALLAVLRADSFEQARESIARIAASLP